MSAATYPSSVTSRPPTPISGSAPIPRTFLLSCGGTGGHLSPGIALAESLLEKGHRPVLLISHKKVDTRLAAKYPALRFEPLPGTPFGLRPGVFLRFLTSQGRGLAAGLRLVRKERPAAIVGFGGFTTAGIILAGRLHGVPVALHESNHVPGKAVRHLARLAARVWLPPGVALPGRPDDPRVRAAAMPVRAEITRLPRVEAAARLGLDPARKTVVVFGGSQGATPLNDWARGAAGELARQGAQLVCVTGLGKGEALVTEHPDPRQPSGSPVRCLWMPFCDDVAALLSAADLVVARAGAGSLAEFARIGVPAVLVPFPQAADDHQRANAAWFAGRGGGVVLEQSALDRLTPLVGSLLHDEPRLAACRAALARIAALPALGLMLEDLEQLIAKT
jgi:UDP-N-acetylglucosamine--N-acetylmuramyl-(pentapeptide) pyrophosphoryl-undecaprenol N-acetylglucosamine transferase